jgi:glycerol-3-phosphate dehydrogenase (NAD(P)+)
MSRIAVIGAGAWGTALSIVLGRKGVHDVRLWAYEEEVRGSIAKVRENTQFLAGQPIPACVRVTGSLSQALDQAQTVVSAMPSQHCRSLYQQMNADLKSDMLVVSATKGLEKESFLRMSEVIDEATNRKCRVGALSGPTFAAEVARGDPTAITIASRDEGLMSTVQQEFGDAAFRVYSNSDVIGVELGGALKNVIAIAAGVCSGIGLGHNSVAALITRGLAEMTRLAAACGARVETMAGLAGMGDLVLTCTGALSRNRSVGRELGQGRALPEIVASMHGMVAEGIFTTDAAMQLARTRGVEMPITEQMQAILTRGKTPREAIQELMTRSSKSELD